jgi:HEAT repeat protein
MEQVSAGFVASAKRDRLHAIRDASAGNDVAGLACALRRMLFTDADAEVRAAAARRLGELAYPTETWLTDALGDHSPLVRESLVRALATNGTAISANAIRRIVETDRVWWVRRTAVYALATCAGAGELAAFKAALGDPFWRVRHAAVRVLAALGANDLELRDELLGEPPDGAARSALQFLRASWGPVAVETPHRAPEASLLPPALLDPDPAVVTARLAELPVSAPLALVELLSDPHVPLRLLAIERLVASRDHAALTAALDWLEAARIPHVADAVEHMLDGLGDDARPLAEHALARTDRPGAAEWAIRWIVATRFEELHPAARAAADRDPALRRAALPLASIDQLVAWAEPLDGIAIELHERHAYDELLARDVATCPSARALQIDAAARRDQWSRVELGLADPHHGPRAVATHWMVRTGRSDGRTQLADPDPAVREAALANRALAPGLIGDRDPWVARAAAECLAHLTRHTHELAADQIAAALVGHASADPWIRAQACLVPLVDERLLGLAIAALGDTDAMVRSAALEALEQGSEIERRLAVLEASAPPAARSMIAAWLRHEAPPLAPIIETTTATARPVADVAQRPFGRAGFSVAPLAISGAFDPSSTALELAADAGVNLWFWEPGYENLTKHLRTHSGDHVITGSYHADARSIEADVDRALRKLRRTHLDVLLLFWSRSPSRVDPAAYAAIAHLKRSGKVRALGFSTHHRELARNAIIASPWDCVMIRHNAAHPGIETELLPTAHEHGTAILTFSALLYGRMLSGPNAPSPAECYRYSLSQPGVTAVISAPRRRSEVRENVAILTQPSLDADRLAAMRAHGIGVRAENQRFNTLLRQPTRDAAAAARALLATELPPSDELIARPLPRPSDARPARTNLGKTRTRR